MTIVKDITSVLMNATFVGAFLTIFFFTYASKVESQIVTKQIKFLADDFAANINLLPSDTKEAIRTKLQNIQLPNFEATDNQIDSVNGKIIKQTLLVVGITLAVVLLTVYILSTQRFFNFSFWEILCKNLIILLFIGLTEFTFLNLVAKNFISIDPNYVKYYALEQLYPTAAQIPPLNIDLLSKEFPKRAIDRPLPKINNIDDDLNGAVLANKHISTIVPNSFDNSAYAFSRGFNAAVSGFDGNIYDAN